MNNVIAGVGVYIFLLLKAAILSSPVLLALVLTRRWTNRAICATVLGVGYAFATAYAIYGFEWFDVWTHGYPGTPYLLKGYLPLMLVYGSVGAFIGRAIGPTRRTPVRQMDVARA